MKKILPVLLVVLLPFIGTAQVDSTTTRTKVGDIAPAFELSISKNKKVSLADYKGKIVVINFFATWYPPCRLDLPRVQKDIWEKYKDNPKFALFVFGRDEDWDIVLPFKKENKYTFSMLPDVGKNIFDLYATAYIPRTLVINEEGKIIFQSIGYQEKEFNELLTLLAEKLK